MSEIVRFFRKVHFKVSWIRIPFFDHCVYHLSQMVLMLASLIGGLSLAESMRILLCCNSSFSTCLNAYSCFFFYHCGSLNERMCINVMDAIHKSISSLWIASNFLPFPYHFPDISRWSESNIVCCCARIKYFYCTAKPTSALCDSLLYR